MAYIAKQSTADEICKELSVTRSWLSFAAKNLGIARSGQGRLQTFPRSEVEIFKNVKILLRLDFTWNQIKSIQQEENLLRKELMATFPQNVNFGHAWITFLFHSSLRLPIIEGGSKYEATINVILYAHSFDEFLNTLKRKIEEVEYQHNQFLRLTQKVLYRPIDFE